MALALRPIEPADLPAAGRIYHEAFKAIAAQHNFPPAFADPEIAIGRLSQLCANPGFYGVVAELDGTDRRQQLSRRALGDHRVGTDHRRPDGAKSERRHGLDGAHARSSGA